MKTRLAMCFGVALLLQLGEARADEPPFYLVKNQKNTIAQLTPAEVKNIFTGKTSRFSTGLVQLVFCKNDLSGPTWLAEKILDVPMQTLFAKIRQEVFRERMNKPMLVETEALVLDVVKTNQAAIAIVPKDALAELPKEVAVVPIVSQEGGQAP